MPMAFRSNAAGRQGIRIRSAARAAASEAASAFGALSMITRSADWAAACFEQARQPGRLGGHDGRGGLVAFVRPARRRRLRIEIEQGGFHAPLFGGNRQMDADGRFTGPAFLADNGDCFHVCPLIGCIVCDHTCKHLNECELGKPEGAQWRQYRSLHANLIILQG